MLRVEDPTSQAPVASANDTTAGVLRPPASFRQLHARHAVSDTATKAPSEAMGAGAAV